MMKLCSSVPDIKLTRERQNSISGWVNPLSKKKKRKEGGKARELKSTTMDFSDPIERVEQETLYLIRSSRKFDHCIKNGG